MSGLRIEVVDEGSLELADDRISELADLQLQAMLEGIGGLVESQTRRRLLETKMSPDGRPWPDWSEAYAGSSHGSGAHEPHPGQRRNAGGHSLLVLDGNLLDSIQYEVVNDEVAVGSNLIYAATHNFGDDDRNIPQREFVGLGPDDVMEIERLVVDYLTEAVG